MSRFARPLTLVVIAAVATGCAGMLGIQPANYTVTIDNETSTELTFAAGADSSTPVDGTVGPGTTGTILHRLGEPPDDDPVFYGSLCTKVDLVALANGREVARHAPGLCMGDTWVIGGPSST